MVADASAYYMLGYTPTGAEDDGKYHKISVKVKRSGTHVLARQGYFAPSSKELAAAAEASARVREPQVASALDSLASRSPASGRSTRGWDCRRGGEEQTKVVVAWDPVEPADTPGGGGSMSRRRSPACRDPSGGIGCGGGKPRGPRPRSTCRRGRSPCVSPPGRRSVRGGHVDPALTAPDWAARPSRCRRRASPARGRCRMGAIQASPDAAPSAVRQFLRSDRVLVAVECYGPTPGARAASSARTC